MSGAGLAPPGRRRLARAVPFTARGPRKKDGEIRRLELVQQLCRLYHSHPGLERRWIEAHRGARWNEYADSLATACRRE